MNTTKEKIEMILNHLGIGPYELANAIGLNQGRISDMKLGKVKKFSPEVATSISRIFPCISQDWMLYGKGNMVVGEQDTAEHQPTNQDQTTTVTNELLVVASTIALQTKEYAEIAKTNAEIQRDTLALMDRMQKQMETMMRWMMSNRPPSATGMAAEPPTEP